MSRKSNSEFSRGVTPLLNFSVPLTTCCGIQHMPEPVSHALWRPGQHSVAVVNTRWDKCVYKTTIFADHVSSECQILCIWQRQQNNDVQIEEMCFSRLRSNENELPSKHMWSLAVISLDQSCNGGPLSPSRTWPWSEQLRLVTVQHDSVCCHPTTHICNAKFKLLQPAIIIVASECRLISWAETMFAKSAVYRINRCRPNTEP